MGFYYVHRLTSKSLLPMQLGYWALWPNMAQNGPHMLTCFHTKPLVSEPFAKNEEVCLCQSRCVSVGRSESLGVGSRFQGPTLSEQPANQDVKLSDTQHHARLLPAMIIIDEPCEAVSKSSVKCFLLEECLAHGASSQQQKATKTACTNIRCASIQYLIIQLLTNFGHYNLEHVIPATHEP